MLVWVQLFVAACCLIPAKAEVVQDFTPCLQFFLDKTPPDASLTPSNPARICQVYKNAYRYATMYDREKRIPIYSAYKCKPGKGDRYNGWMIEPQLVNLDFKKDMEDERETKIPVKEIEKSQATSRDYSTAYFYEMGHLNPVCHQPDEDSKAATSTLTNIVPQFSTLNQGTWTKYEENIKNKASSCQDLYVITGVVPGKNYTADNRVNKPSHIWSAACCVKATGERTSMAAIAQNDEDVVKQYTLEELKTDLASLYNKEQVHPFNNACH